MQKRKNFLFDRMLGRLCRKMRLLGYDSKLNPEGEKGRFLLNADQEERIAVTRSRRHHDRPGPNPLILAGEEPVEQVVELFRKLGEAPAFEPFTRCLECNTLLVEELPSSVHGDIPPLVEKEFKSYHRCPGCRRIYWEGSHYQAMAEEIKEIESRFKK